ncbi:GNAT family N-acetyltransferase [Lignipirellula cremea]|uniref:Acetyltransferase (GNAT) family protein n=1 Tax=Lignipirellula cremea TaxID=2528010 RepID=A0A518DNW3_9BACT|nr:GNAT family N-acetyltransferase [Lignipirellula cremea]QDU93527.1 Acetyltransferase (GNAT) family protein [Lignipirellula cremea]
MSQIEATVYYLQMTAPPETAGRPLPEETRVERAIDPPVPFYRFLYHAIGGDYQWLSRRKLSDADLAVLLGDPRNELFVLYCQGVPAGMVEFDRRQPNEVEIVQFGLMPERIGQGLGRSLLEWTLARAWSYQPSRVWLHTCSLDHPAALPNYQKRGFTLYREERIQREP